MKYTRQQAITANCFDCIYDPANGGSKHQQTDACASVNCPFYEYRPVTGATKDRIKQERIAGYSDEELKEYKRRGDDFRARIHNKT